ncbi:MAG: tellurite resistance/C4-dicarboxylate transporter family protein [Acidobacteriota bacterium]
MTGSWQEGIRTLHPAYFALVMATGIVSIAAKLFGMDAISRTMVIINVAAFIVLWAVTVIRVVRFPGDVVADLFDHQRSVGFFTSVAATSVLGAQILIVTSNSALAFALWIATVALWLGLVYAVFTALTVKDEKPPLDQGINGGWLVAVVATESVSTLASLVSATVHRPDILLFVSLSFWLAGGMLYIWLISLIFYRYTFFRFSPSDLMPPYWINMGAMAISTLAGTLLIANEQGSSLLRNLRPFLLGLTILFWATATWWIPMLLILGFWRHIWKRFPLEYHPLYWGAVFPLGMYTVCTYRLAGVAEVPYLLPVAHVFVFVALAAWTATFIGLIRRLAGMAVSPVRSS